MKNNKYYILLFWGFIYYLSYVISDFINDQDDVYYTIWLPSGIAITALLTVQKKCWPLLIFLFWVANFVVNLDVIYDNFKLYTVTFLSVITLLELLSPVLISIIIKASYNINSPPIKIAIWIVSILVICSIDNIISFYILYFIGAHENINEIAITWFFDITNIILTTTIFLGLFNSYKDFYFLNKKQIITLSISLILMTLISYAIFSNFLYMLIASLIGDVSPGIKVLISCIPIIFIIISTVTTGRIGRSFSLFIFSAIVIYYSYKSKNIFSITEFSYSESLLLVLCYLSSITIFSLLISFLSPKYEHDLFTIKTLKPIHYKYNVKADYIIFDYDVTKYLNLKHKSMFNDVIKLIHPEDIRKFNEHKKNKSIKSNLIINFRIKNRKGEWQLIQDTIFLDEKQKNIIIFGEWLFVFL